MAKAAVASPTPKDKSKSAIPMKEFIVRRQEEAGLSNAELAQMTGYDSVNVIAMLRNGNMAFPLNKVKVFAKALGVDPVFMLQRALEARNPELLDVIQEILGRQMVSENQAKLLEFFNKELGGQEFDVMQHPEFIEGVRPLLAKVANREVALHKAAMEAIKRNYKPGPKKAA